MFLRYHGQVVLDLREETFLIREKQTVIGPLHQNVPVRNIQSINLFLAMKVHVSVFYRVSIESRSLFFFYLPLWFYQLRVSPSIIDKSAIIMYNGETTKYKTSYDLCMHINNLYKECF